MKNYFMPIVEAIKLSNRPKKNTNIKISEV